MDGAYHLADEISNTFYSFLSNIFGGIDPILPLGIRDSRSTNPWGIQVSSQLLSYKRNRKQIALYLDI